MDGREEDSVVTAQDGAIPKPARKGLLSGKLRVGKKKNKVHVVPKSLEVITPAAGSLQNNVQDVEAEKKAVKKINQAKKGILLPKGVEIVASNSKGNNYFIKFRSVDSLEQQEKESPGVEVNEPNHVNSCTCPECRKAKRRNRNKPIQLKFKAGLRLIECTFEANGFAKTIKDDWNVLWVSNSLKPHVYQTLRRFQKVNQFPRTYEITRKDQLCRNMTRMQQAHGSKHFDFFPKTYVLPEDRNTFEEQVRKSADESVFEGLHGKRRGKQDDSPPLWIVKPAASACGRGIFVTDNIADIPLGGSEDSNLIVSEYIANPLLLDERKFDLRIYVAVTSFNPLRIYTYEEGLVRLTTQSYSKDIDSLKNRLVHLTNYSVQKKSETFVQNNGETEEDASSRSDSEQPSSSGLENSSKWSLKMFRARMEKMGQDPSKIFQEIESVIVKTLISIEPQVVRAMEMHLRHPSSSFQLFGFDILIDENYKPWLIEVNLGPSLSCDSPLDLNIKSEMVADLLTLSGVKPVDIARARQKEDLPRGVRPPRLAQTSSGLLGKVQQIDAATTLKHVEKLKSEQERCGKWKCVYPTETSFVFDRFFETKGLNQAISQHLSSGKSISDKKRIAKGLARAKTTEKL